MATGILSIEKVNGKSTLTRCFSKYPLKLISPTKVGSSSTTDAVWIYTLSFGGGIVSVFKAVGSKCSEQILEARIGSNALLALIPDPVTCFSTARYSQKQIFKINLESNLVIVDWITSGRYGSGEKWDFDLYKSINHIYLEDNEPLFLDSVLLDQNSTATISDRMQDYQVIAMVILFGAKIRFIQNKVEGEVKQMMSGKFSAPTVNSRNHMRSESDHASNRPPPLLASCSSFGPKGIGVVVRLAATTTESIYEFLRYNLSSLEQFLGTRPYHQ